MTYQFHPEAAAEFEAHAAWYEEQRPGSGDELAAGVWRAVDQLIEQPTLGSIVSGAAPARRVLLASFPVSIIHSVRDGRVFVFAVLT